MTGLSEKAGQGYSRGVSHYAGTVQVDSGTRMVQILMIIITTYCGKWERALDELRCLGSSDQDDLGTSGKMGSGKVGEVRIDWSLYPTAACLALWLSVAAPTLLPPCGWEWDPPGAQAGVRHNFQDAGLVLAYAPFLFLFWRGWDGLGEVGHRWRGNWSTLVLSLDSFDWFSRGARSWSRSSINPPPCPSLRLVAQTCNH